jgi:TRAP-type mannitol/chloroaromatic compound transport system substrate-binding protein
MDRRSFIRKAGLAAGGVAASTLAAPALAQSQPQVKWRLTSGFPKTLAIYNAADVFSKVVSDMTDGNWQIQNFQNGEIVAQANIVDAIQQGTVEMAHTASYYYFGKDPTFAFGTTVPFGLNPRQENAWFYYQGGNDLLNAFYKKYNIYALPGGNTGAQMGGWWRKEIKTVDDLKGVKFRVGGFGGAVLSKLGVVPQNIAANDIYTSLEKGTIDAAEWVGPYDDEKLGLNKVAPYYYYPGWWEGSAAIHFFFNTDAWNKLPKNYQAIATSAAAHANGDMLAQYDSLNTAALKRLVQAGAMLRPFSPEIMQASFNAATQTCNEISAMNPDFKKVWDAIRPLRDDGFLWEQLADGPFDQFMMGQQSKGALKG